jgi:hypothetical protein
MTDPNNTDENNEALVNPNPEKFKKFLLKKSFKLAKDNLKEQ